MSLRGRLLVAVVAVLVAGLLVADVSIYFAMRSFLLGRVDRQLVGATASVQQALDAPGRAGRVDLEQLNAVVPGVFVQVRDDQGRVVASTLVRGFEDPVTPRLPDDLPAGSGTTFDVPASDDHHYRVLVSQLGPAGNTLLIGLPLADTEGTLQRILVVESLVSLAVLVSAGATGFLLVRVGLRPLDDIGDTARTIGEGDLSKRVAHDDERTEIGRLGHSLNMMLMQIETAFDQRRQSEERMRRFVADASHELRTPLAAVSAYAELFDRGAVNNPDDLARSMRGIQGQAARMGLLVDDLLLLTRLDQGRPLDRKPEPLARIVQEAVDDARVIAPVRKIETLLEADGVVLGDESRLRQVLDNLLANVRSHTPPETAARVRLYEETGRAVVEVADDGPGLTPEQAKRVFERFYRADSARSRASGGNGLGLSIVDAIVRAHDGETTVSSEPDVGTTFVTKIPLHSTRTEGDSKVPHSKPQAASSILAPNAQQNETAEHEVIEE